MLTVNISLSQAEEDENFDFDEQISTPVACIGCFNYHGAKSGEHLLVCDIYYLAWDDDNCPDFINP